MRCIKVTIKNQDIRLLVTIKVLLTIISWMAEWIHMIKIALKSTY